MGKDNSKMMTKFQLVNTKLLKRQRISCKYEKSDTFLPTLAAFPRHTFSLRFSHDIGPKHSSIQALHNKDTSKPSTQKGKKEAQDLNSYAIAMEENRRKAARNSNIIIIITSWLMLSLLEQMNCISSESSSINWVWHSRKTTKTKEPSLPSFTDSVHNMRA